MKLKNCPFCGSDKITKCRHTCSIGCSGCGAECGFDEEYWNRRASPWIPVSEGFPDLCFDGISNNVDCMVDGVREADCQYHEDGGWFNLDGENINPTHWMPIPPLEGE